MIKLTNTMIRQQGVSFVDLFVIYVSSLSLLCYLVYSLQPFDHLLGKGDLLAG